MEILGREVRVPLFFERSPQIGSCLTNRIPHFMKYIYKYFLDVDVKLQVFTDSNWMIKLDLIAIYISSLVNVNLQFSSRFSLILSIRCSSH